MVLDEKSEARVEIVDLRTQSVILRVRRKLEETSSSASAAIYREAIQSCALARAVRHAAEG